jgi:hypothetical protein
MTATEFADHCRAIRLADDPAGLARIREQLDQEHGNDPDARQLRFMATTKR